MKKHKCKICKRIFYDYESNHRKMCSVECSNKNTSIIRTGISATWMIGRKPWNYGIEGLKGCKNGHWKGGKNINQGYVYVLNPTHPNAKKSGYVAEHRIIIEMYLGRITTKKESPHHKNKIRNDNRIKNLILYKDKATHNRADYGHKIPLSDIVFDGAKVKKEK